MKYFLCFTFFIFSVLGIVFCEECNEEDLKKCLNNLQSLLKRYLNAYPKSEDDINDYCKTLKLSGDCLKDASAACEKDNPKLASLIASFYKYLNQICSKSRQNYMDMIPCFMKYRSEFESCFENSHAYGADEHFEEVCKEVSAMECTAKTSRKLCDNAESFAKALDAPVKELKYGVCNKSPITSCSIGVIFALLIFVLLNNKRLL